MLKLAAFSVSELEKPYFEIARKKYGVEFVIETSNDLTLAEAEKIPVGVDGVLVLPKEPTTKAILAVLKEKKISSLATRSAGLDAIDIVTAKELGITVTNVAAYSPQAIAEFAVMLILTSLRRIREINLNMEKGDFIGIPLITHQMDSRTIGIIGYGHIGQCVARLLQPFGAKLVVYTLEEIAPELLLPNMEIERNLTAFFQKTNVITIHCPYTPETYHLINEAAIKQMSQEMIIINTARGPIVDAKSVLQALDEDNLTFYATDVYEHEHEVFHKHFADINDIADDVFKAMLASPKVSITPHIAFNTYTSVQNMVYFSIENTIEVLK